MSRNREGERPSAYEILGVHPSAPTELVSAAYWMTVEEIQTAREHGEEVDSALHLLTRAYESVANSEVRAGYNLSLGYSGASFLTRPLTRRRLGLFEVLDEFNYYEVLGLHQSAPRKLVEEAYRVMRSLYMRPQLMVDSTRRIRLLRLLNQAYEALADDARRMAFDDRVARRNPAAASAPEAGRNALGTTMKRLVGVLFRRRPQSKPVQPTMLARLRQFLNGDSTSTSAVTS